MEPVSFIDPFAAEERVAIARPTGVPRIRAPPLNPRTAQALPSRGREREVQQLSHDLAVLG